MTNLFSPIKIKSIDFKNRIVVSPMCQYSSTDGFATDWHLVHLGSRAVGGAALIISEATAVSPEGRISPGDLGIWKEEHIPPLKRITDFIHTNGAVAGIQLAHAGRKASHDLPWNGSGLLNTENNGWETMAPSAIPFTENDSTPKELSIKEIKEIVNNFKLAASRALQAGFKVVEIHAAHGYLINEFLSPLVNKRTDEYGGSFENRCRFLLEIIDAIHIVWPADLPVFVRISATDWADGGWNVMDSIKLANILKTKNIDVVDCSTGGNVADAQIPVALLYQVTFAESIKRQTGILTGAVGLITTPKDANDIIVENRADLIFLAREMLRDPYFALRAARELKEDVIWPKQYERAKRK